MWQQTRPVSNKFFNQITEYNGRKYDSKGEAGLAQTLDLLVKAGELKDVRPQVKFPLYGKNGTVICNHIVDFLATLPDGTYRVYEYKGIPLPVWKIKLALFEDSYPDIPYNIITSNWKKNPYGKAKRRRSRSN